MTARRMKLSDLHTTSTLQPRGDKLDADVVNDYAAAARAGDKFPPLVAFAVTDRKFKGPALVAGFHRKAAYEKAKITEADVEVRTGTFEDAWECAVRSNKGHGLRYTNSQKRNAVDQTLLICRNKSAQQIADMVGVSKNFVNVRRKAMVELKKLAPIAEVTTSDGGKRTVKPPSEETSSDDVSSDQSQNDAEPVNQPDPSANGEVDGRSGDEPPSSGGCSDAGEGSAAVEPAGPEPVIVPPAPVDDWGIPVQPHAAEAFAALPQFKELVGLLQQCQRLFNALANTKGGVFLTLPEVSSYRRGKKQDDGGYADRFVHEGLETCLRQVKNAAPTHTVCPWNYVEAPHPRDCKTCLNQNWTPALGNSVPDSAVARAKGVFGV